MKKFSFQFESLQKVRKAREDEAVRALAEMQRRHQDEIRNKERLVAELQAGLFRRETLADQDTTSVAFLIEENFIVGTKQRIIQADQAIVRANRLVEKAMRGYLHARRQVKMMEVLREKAYEQFRRERIKKEQAELDDLVTMRSQLEKIGVAG